MERKRRKRMNALSWGVGIIMAVCTLAALRTFYSDADLLRRSKRQSNTDFASTTSNQTFSTAVLPPNSSSSPTTKPQGIYPRDYITLEMRRRGGVIVHIFVLLYMFTALAIVCDEFFVPALEVITYRLAISDDVAGATFMAAGGSAPELFTSIIGVFLAQSNVGVGTIVGSAVFNILFVIGMCSLFSREILQLTWWPLFRDCSFYIISLVFLMYAFSDASVQYYESIVLILVYLSYVTFMKYNQVIEQWIKKKFATCRSKPKSRSNSKKVSPSVRAIVESISDPREISNPKNNFSYGIVQLIMHSLDPGTNYDEDKDSPAQLYALAKGSTISPRAARALCTSPTRKCQIYEKREGERRPPTPTAVIYENEGVKVVPQGETAHERYIDSTCNHVAENNTSNREPLNNNDFKDGERNGNGRVSSCNNGTSSSKREHVADPNEEKGDALDMSWPKTNAKRCVYVFLFPIMFLLWITLPDVRIPKKEKWFMGSFFGSICWIAVFSYVMVWMARQIGQTIYITDTVMGLTILAAGTSVPDLITSVIVARKGLGDMAVSSSVGSNIFDVTIGLPFPWLLKSIIYLGEPVDVQSSGLFCSILLLLGMLLFVVISIAFFGWKMNKKLGIVLLVLYALFLILALLLELDVVDCLIGA